MSLDHSLRSEPGNFVAEKSVVDDLTTRCMKKMRTVPGIGLLMALFSGFCFATAGFTVELMNGTDPHDGHGVDAWVIVICM